MKENVLNEILEWSSSLPAWQRDALRRLFTSGKVGEPGLQELLDLCKSAHGLHEVVAPLPLTIEHIAIGNAVSAPVSISSVTHHRGVNALSSEQTLSFGPHLTVVYGENAAGKSGYTRILKKACRSRAAEEILGNVLTESKPLKGMATIKLLVGGAERTVSWSPDASPTQELAAVSVFDSQCAPVYLHDKTDVAFRPFSLDVFDKLSAVCAEIKKRLDTEQRALSNSLPSMPTIDAKTKAGALVASLTSLTKPDDVAALATLSVDEQARMELLSVKQRDFLSLDPRKRAGELDAMARRIDAVTTHIDFVASTLSAQAIANLGASRKKREVASNALAQLRATVLTIDLLPKTGEAAWRRMWDAAAAFANNSFPGKGFPWVSGDDNCVLCQQPLSASAVTRFARFKELVESKAQNELSTAERDYSGATKSIVDAKIDREDMRLTIGELRAENGALADQLEKFLSGALRIQADVAAAITAGSLMPLSKMDSGLATTVRSLAGRVRDRASELRNGARTFSDAEASELGELKARVALHEHLSVVQDEIERKKRLAAYSQAIDETGTQAITRKSTELTKRFITDRLRREFQEELDKLDFTHLAVEIRPAGGSKGTLFHKLVFRNAPGVPITTVLSEGESRTLSLASFLTELSTAPSASAIIFDDPVSSLDHVWRERIGRRLVFESLARQVIVFTHDLLFLKVLIDEAEAQGASVSHQYVRHGSDGTGLASPDLPWIAMPTKSRIGVLKQRWQTAEKLFRQGDLQAYEREGREVYGLLREAWEHATGEVLLHDVIERYRPSIETQKARVLHDITEPDCVALEAGMRESSKWIRGHDHPAADGTPFPAPGELKQRIDDFEIWVKQIHKRRGQ